MNIIICDDNRVDRGILKLIITDIFQKAEVPLDITECDSLTTFAKSYSKDCDLIFMDIYLQDGNGVEIAKRIRCFDEEIPIIFVTASTDFLLESYNVFAYNYLVKPLEYERVSALMRRLFREKQIKETPDPEYSLKDTRGNTRMSIPYSKIEYVESFNTLLMFHLTNGLDFKMYGTLKSVFSQLADPRFIHCHQSFIANLEHVEKLENNMFIMESGDEVMIRKKGLREIKNLYLNYTLHQD